MRADLGFGSAVLALPLLLAMLLLIPVTAIGHAIGLKTHDMLLQNDRLFKRAFGLARIAIATVGIWRLS